MPKPKPPYPPEFRVEAVRLVRDGGRKMSEVARNLGVTVETLRKWLRQEEVDTEDREGVSTSEREELQRLRRENRMLKEEREILSAGSLPQRVLCLAQAGPLRQRSGKLEPH